MTARRSRRLGAAAALSAAMAIACGAFGAHGAGSVAAANLLRTGGEYQLIHALAVLTLMRRHTTSATLLLAGSIIFAVSLYALAFGAARAVGAITPIGGGLMIGGWLCAAWGLARGAADD